MSTVKTTNLQHPSSGSANITLAADGSVVLPAGFTGGIGSNVVQTVKTDTFSTTSTSMVDVTGFSLTITPTSATSKILVLANFTLGASTNVIRVSTQLVRNSTDIYESAGNAHSSFHSTSENTDRDADNQTLVFLDSPATTSAVTYKLQMSTTTGTGYFGRWGQDANTNAPASITAIEVAA